MDTGTARPRTERQHLQGLLAAHGIQPTAQRLRIAELLFARNWHCTAEQVFEALGHDGGRVARATVYNTLNLFAARGLIRALTVDSECCQFDSNVRPHHHFFLEDTGEVMDIPAGELEFARLPEPPPGMEANGIEVVVRVRRRA